MGLQEEKKLNYLFVALDCGVDLYQKTSELILAELKKDANISMLACDGALNRCTVLQSKGVSLADGWDSFNKESICRNCRKKQRRYSYDTKHKVKSYLTEEQTYFIRNGLSKNNDDPRLLLDRLSWKGCRVGYFAFYAFATVYKLDVAALKDPGWRKEYVYFLEDCLYLINTIHSLSSSVIFDGMLYVNGNYSLNSTARECARQVCKEFWSIEYALSSSAYFARIYLEPDRLKAPEAWMGYQSSIERKTELKDYIVAINALKHRVVGKTFNSYTSIKNRENARVAKLLGSYKRIISVFLSSTTEFMVHEVVHGAAEGVNLFSDQGEWIDFISNNLSNDVGYIIRMHPRLAPNKRESILSPEVDLINAMLEPIRFKSNVVVVDAEDNTSSFYLVMNSDLVLTSWSTISLEAAFLGVPSISAFPERLIYPLAEWIGHPESKVEYRAILRGENQPVFIEEFNRPLLDWISRVFSSIGFIIPVIRNNSSIIGRILFIVFGVIPFSRLFFKTSLIDALSPLGLRSHSSALPDSRTDDVFVYRLAESKLRKARSRFRDKLQIRGAGTLGPDF